MKKWILISAAVLAAMIALCCTSSYALHLLLRYEVEPASYADIKLGDARDKVIQLKANDRFLLLGHLYRENGKAYWLPEYLNHDGPIELTDAQLQDNSYMKSSGYTYPPPPSPHEMLLFLDRQERLGNWIYFLLDDTGKVIKIYRGDS